MKKFLKWSFILGGILLVITVLIFGFGIWASYETGKRLDIGYGVSTNPRLVRLEIGDKVFAIPQNHIWSREDWKGGKVQGVNLQALLPNFEPYTEANRHEFEGLGWNRTISLLLKQSNAYTKNKTTISRLETYKQLTPGGDITTKPAQFGLTRVYGITWSAEKEFFIGTLPDGGFYWTTCSPEGKHKSPSCNTLANYSDYTYIDYTFAKKYLPDWASIDKGVVNLLRQFEIKEKLGEQK